MPPPRKPFPSSPQEAVSIYKVQLKPYHPPSNLP